MSDEIEIGPVDYLVIEIPEANVDGSGLEALLDLVEQGTIRILDMGFLRKDADGTLEVLDISALGATYAVFEGASSGLLGDDDFSEVATALEPGVIAAVLVYENSWAAPFATALRRNGAQLVASGRIPINAVLAALDAADN
jgi:dihydroorotase-like cyclic amidohydrolase